MAHRSELTLLQGQAATDAQQTALPQPLHSSSAKTAKNRPLSDEEVSIWFASLIAQKGDVCIDQVSRKPIPNYGYLLVPLIPSSRQSAKPNADHNHSSSVKDSAVKVSKVKSHCEQWDPLLEQLREAELMYVLRESFLYW